MLDYCENKIMGFHFEGLTKEYLTVKEFRVCIFDGLRSFQFYGTNLFSQPIKSLILVSFLILFLLNPLISQSQNSQLQARGINHYKKADSLWNLNRDSSLHYFKSAIRSLSYEKNPKELIYSLNGIFKIFDINQEFDSSRKYIVNARNYLIDDEGSIDELRALTLNNYSSFLFRIGDPNGALEQLNELVSFTSKNDSSTREMLPFIFYNLGFQHLELGDYFEAEKYYFMSNVSDTFGDFIKPFNLNNSLGKLFEEQQEYRKALKYYKEAINEFDSLENEVSRLLDIYESLAEIYIVLNQNDSVQYYINLARELDRGNLFYREDEIFGRFFLHKRKCEEAKEKLLYALKKSQIHFVQRPNHPDITIRYQNLGQAYALCQQFDSAMYYFQTGLTFSSDLEVDEPFLSLPRLETIRYPHHALPVLIAKAHALHEWYQGDHQFKHLLAAYQTYFLATKVIDRLRMGFQSGKSKMLLSEKAIPTYEATIQIGWELFQLTGQEKYLHELFQIMEQNKASTLLQQIRAGEIKNYLGVPDSLLAKERELKIDLAFYQKQLHEEKEKIDGQDSSLIERWRNKIFEREERLRSLERHLADDFPQYHRLQYQELELRISEARRTLINPREMLLEFFWGEESVFALALSKDDISFAEIKRDSVLEQAINRMKALLADRRSAKQWGNSQESRREFIQLGYFLFQSLLEPVIDSSTEYEGLQIIPDGPLSGLPFELLLTQRDSQGDSFRDLSYLIQDFAVSYAYSVQLLQQGHKKREPPEKGFAGFAPSYGSDEWYASSRSLMELDSGVRAGFSSLFYNQEEVRSIAKTWKGSTWLGEDASELAFKRSAPDFQILHLAMHAYINNQAPELSGLVFSQARDSLSQSEEGILHAYEIYNLNLNADLAVLSACNTGTGVWQKGEGIMSLARAFTYAGCPSLIMSLWQADDEATRFLMERFYTYLKQGEKKSRALRFAKLDYLKLSDRIHPHFWAAFTMIGVNDPVEPKPNPLHWWSALILLVLLFGIWRFFKMRSSQANVKVL
jgi:CHAT domain-containing protein